MRFPSAAEWNFAPAMWLEVRDFLRDAGVSAADLARLSEPDRREVDAERQLVVLRVPDEVRLALGKQTRETIYRRLGMVDLNEAHLMPFMLPSDDAIDRASFNPALRARIEQLMFPRGRRRTLVDADLLDPLVRDEAEGLRLRRLLFSYPALQVELTRADPSSREAVAAYWTREGRGAGRQWLERAARSPNLETIDLGNLLPGLPQSLLNRFPDGIESPLDANCYWTALNFFRSEAGSQFLPSRSRSVEAVVRQEFEDHYDRVVDEPQFGDVWAFFWVRADGRKDLVHVVVHLADEIVFTKNGVGPTSPFVFARHGDVHDYYDWCYDLKVERYRPRAGGPARPLH